MVARGILKSELIAKRKRFCAALVHPIWFESFCGVSGPGAIHPSRPFRFQVCGDGQALRPTRPATDTITRIAAGWVSS
jgi:hypothetical protein